MSLFITTAMLALSAQDPVLEEYRLPETCSTEAYVSAGSAELSRIKGAPDGAAATLGSDELFPEASEDMILAAGEAPTSMGGLVQEYMRLTGQHIHASTRTREALDAIPTGMLESVAVPKAQVQIVFERLLSQNGFMLLYERGAGSQLLSIVSRQTGEHDAVRSRAYFVPQGELSAWQGHPAVLITTVVHLPNTDTRQLSNAMRTMITDNRFEQIIPAGGERSLLLTGLADWVVARAQTYRAVDDAAAERERKASSLGGVHRFQLENANAPDVALLIDGLTFTVAQGADGRPSRGHDRPRVIADQRTNALVVMCNPGDLVRIEELIVLFDVKQD